MVTEIYRATLKRIRRTDAQLEQLDAQIIAILKEDHPQSVRHVFYRMTDPRLPEPVEKSDKGYRHVQERCVKLRRAGEAESMPAKVLREILRDKVEALLPENALAVAKVAEQSEREHLDFMASLHLDLGDGGEDKGA